MKIAAIHLVRLRVPLDPPFLAAWDPEPRTSFGLTLVRVETDEGVVGIGSGDTMDGFDAFAPVAPEATGALTSRAVADSASRQMVKRRRISIPLSTDPVAD